MQGVYPAVILDRRWESRVRIRLKWGRRCGALEQGWHVSCGRHVPCLAHWEAQWSCARERLARTSASSLRSRVCRKWLDVSSTEASDDYE